MDVPLCSMNNLILAAHLHFLETRCEALFGSIDDVRRQIQRVVHGVQDARPGVVERLWFIYVQHFCQTFVLRSPLSSKDRGKAFMLFILPVLFLRCAQELKNVITAGMTAEAGFSSS